MAQKRSGGKRAVRRHQAVVSAGNDLGGKGFGFGPLLAVEVQAGAQGAGGGFHGAVASGGFGQEGFGLSEVGQHLVIGLGLGAAAQALAVGLAAGGRERQRHPAPAAAQVKIHEGPQEISLAQQLGFLRRWQQRVGDAGHGRNHVIGPVHGLVHLGPSFGNQHVVGAELVLVNFQKLVQRAVKAHVFPG